MPYKSIVFYLLLIFHQVKSQSPEWMTFCGGTCVYGLLCKEDTVWIHTTGGIAKLNTITEKMEFYNTGNSELKSNHVRALALDSTGSLWAGTHWGVSRYNGKEWTAYTTANSNISTYYINSLAVDKDNNVWAGTWGCSEISLFNGTAWNHYAVAPPAMPQNSIEAILTDWRGKTLVGWKGSLLNVGRDSIIDTVLGIIGVTDIVRDSIDNIWIASQVSGIYYFDGAILDTINSGLPSNEVWGLCYDNTSRLYAMTRKNLLRYDNGVWVDCLSLGTLTGFDSDNKGNFWLGTAESYCYKWDGKQAKQYCPFNFPHRLCPRSIGIDSKGRCWAGNWTGPGLDDTVIYFDGKEWHKLGFEGVSTVLDSLSFNKICDMDSLKIWVDSHCALVYTAYEWYCYTIGGRYGHGSEVKRDRKGRHWYATGYGLWRFDTNGGYLFTKDNSSLPGEYVYKIAIDSTDKLWMSVIVKYINGEQSWLVTLEDTSFTIARTCDLYYMIPDIEIDFNENVWFTETDRSTAGIEFGHGVFKLSGSNLDNYTISNSPLTSNTVFDLSLDRNNTLWMATYGTGIDTLRITDNTWGCFTVENSHITDNNLTQIEIDARDNKWIKSHMKGLTIYRKGGIDFQTSIKPLPENKTSSKTVTPLYIKDTKLYFKTTSRIAGSITVYSLTGRKIASLDKKIYAPGMHCLPLKSDNISRSVLIVQIDSLKEKHRFKVFNVNR